MKKALLYTLLFVLLTIVVFFAVIFVLPFMLWFGTESGSQGNTIFDTYPLLLPSLSVIIWSVITLFIFIKNKYSDVSFGNIAPKHRLRVILLGGISVLLLKTALQPLLWIGDNEVSESRYGIIQMWMHNDVLVVSLLALIHITLETVVFSAILRELIIWSKRPVICVFVVAVICTIPSFSEVSAEAALPLLCSFIPMMYSGWLYYRTGSIWPSLFGMILYDALLLFTSVFDLFSFVIVSTLVMPWVVIYLAKKLPDNVKPVISR